MPIVFAVRGDSFDARYSSGGKTPTIYTSSSPGGYAQIGTARPGINGSTSIDMYGTGFSSPTGGVRPVFWEGDLNTPAGRPRSALIRFLLEDYTASGAPLFGLFGLYNLALNGFGATALNTAEIRVEIYNNLFQNFLVSSTTASLVEEVWYDLLVCWDGTTSSGGVTAYLDGVSIISATSTRELPATFDATQRKMITRCGLGYSPAASRFSSHWIDEFVVWDTVLPSATVTLESGSGLLNGASRTSYVAVDEFDGMASTGGGRIVKML